MEIAATYFDGETARDQAVQLRRTDSALEFEGPQTPLTTWSLSGLHAIDAPSEGQPFRITHDSHRGARLIITDRDFVTALLASNPKLHGSYGWGHIGQVLAWTAGGLAAFAVAGWFVMSFLPQQVANMLPDNWRKRQGEQMISSLVEDAKRCDTAEGREALSAMVAALAEGRPDIPALSVEVYNLPVLNAFAVPGGRIVITRELLRAADEPSEVTGVLAHELGHVALKHPEAQLVRYAGLQVLMSLLGGNSQIFSSMAAVASLLSYSREAEAEADTYARDTIVAASVDPMGLRHFFEKVMKEEGDTPGAKEGERYATLRRLGTMFSTHPGTPERIAQIQPLPAGKTPVQIMTPDQWKALKAICN